MLPPAKSQSVCWEEQIEAERKEETGRERNFRGKWEKAYSFMGRIKEQIREG